MFYSFTEGFGRCGEGITISDTLVQRTEPVDGESRVESLFAIACEARASVRVGEWCSAQKFWVSRGRMHAPSMRARRSASGRVYILYLFLSRAHATTRLAGVQLHGMSMCTVPYYTTRHSSAPHSARYSSIQLSADSCIQSIRING